MESGNHKNPGGQMSFLKGIVTPFHGAGIIFRNRSMAVLTLIPFFLNIALLIFLFFYAYGKLSDTTMNLLPFSGESTSFWFSLLLGVLKTALAAVIFLLISLFYLSSAAVIAGPFNGILSEMTEKKLLGRQRESNSFRIGGFFSDLLRILTQEIRKIVLILSIFMAAFIFNFIPLIGTFLYGMISYASLTFFTGLEYLDFPMENRKLNFNEKLRFCREHFFLTVGIGITVTLFMYIPFIFCFAATGATRTYLIMKGEIR
jgi:CysZ protein